MTDPTMNQYAPPLAQVADVALPTEAAPLKLFSAQGRIGRLRYLAYSSGAYFVYALVLGVLMAAFGQSSEAATGVTLLTFAVVLWFSILTGIKRCHDIGASGWWSLTIIIPLIGLVWLFMPGNKDANRFGPPPPPNTWGVRLLGAILPVVFVVGILAAVAIPSYQTYVNKARAAQEAGQQR